MSTTFPPVGTALRQLFASRTQSSSYICRVQRSDLLISMEFIARRVHAAFSQLVDIHSFLLSITRSLALSATQEIKDLEISLGWEYFLQRRKKMFRNIPGLGRISSGFVAGRGGE